MVEYISTKCSTPEFNFLQAMHAGIAPNNGLFVPKKIPALSAKSINLLCESNNIIATGIKILQEMIPEFSTDVLTDLLTRSLNFKIPLIHLKNNIYILELFHGPTLAFKDVGARFMANAFAHSLKQQNEKINIISATSGDTGSAVAAGFHLIPNINVYILYPENHVTDLQEKQMATLGGNIHPIKVRGNFDDCQKLVKQALDDENLFKKTGVKFSTANSINIARLLPQMIYHAWGIIQLKNNFGFDNPIFSVPSGNLGNLTAAVYTAARGFNIKKFIAATNSNLTLKNYLTTGNYSPSNAIHTHASAMDVANPSNLERIRYYFNKDITAIRNKLDVIAITDTQIIKNIENIYQQTNYISDPHTATGIAAAELFSNKNNLNLNQPIIVTATAHPAKFPHVLELALGKKASPHHPTLDALAQKSIISRAIANDYLTLVDVLIN